MLTVENLSVHYGAVEAVRGVDLAIEEGELVALLGANGAGKSSTLNAIVGFEPVHAGQISLAGMDITGLATEALVRRQMTLVPEGRRVFGGLTVEENLVLGGYTKHEKTRYQANLDRVMTLFPILRERRKQFAGTLSGGQQQMLAIARALMSEPKLLLLDEPSLGLAPQIVDDIFDLIASLRKDGLTLLMVEQNVAMALEIVDRAYVMSGGVIVASGSAEELRSSDMVEQAYLGSH